MKLVKTLALATAIGLPATAAVAQSTEHHVRVERNGFFPQPLYVQPGDTIRFENVSPNWVRIWSEDPQDDFASYDANDPCDVNDPDGDNVAEYEGEKDGFNVPWFNVGQSVTITVTACMETRFFQPEVWQWNFDGGRRIDLIVFGEAPTGS